MRFPKISLLLPLVVLHRKVLAKNVELKQPESATLFQDDVMYWSRLLMYSDAASMTSNPPTPRPTESPSQDTSTPLPSSLPSKGPSSKPSEDSSVSPSPAPSSDPSVSPSPAPSSDPSVSPSPAPSRNPSLAPSSDTSSDPSLAPSPVPSSDPSLSPSLDPSSNPSLVPSPDPSIDPSLPPSSDPSSNPSLAPSPDPSTDPSLSPSPDPSSDPSLSPSPGPSSDPTSFPTLDPSSLSSSMPSDTPPSSSPSLLVSSSPSSIPTSIPSSIPSSEPSEAQSCFVDVSILCTDSNGTDCASIAAPDEECSDGGAIDLLSFMYVGGLCDQSRNSQDNDSCRDFNGGPIDGPDSRIVCASGVGNTFHDAIVSVGEMVVIPAPFGPESDRLFCTISANETQLQTVVVSGEENFFLKDVYGSLQLERCNTQSCVVPITYTYVIENTGNISLGVVSVDRTRNGQSDDLIDDVDPKSLIAGESTQVQESEVLDVCAIGSFDTVVRVMANSEQGISCAAMDDYSFSVVPACRINLEVGCTVQDGTLAGQDCRMLEGVTMPQCSGSGPSEVCFLYTANQCEQNDTAPGLLACEDFGFGPQRMAEVSVSDDTNIIQTEVVTAGNEFCVTNNGNVLPTSLFFNVSLPNGGILSQVVQIDTSCTGIGLKLLDSFGSLDFVRYVNGNGEQDCFTQVEYDYVIANTGPVALNITELIRTLNSVPRSLIPDNTDPAELQLVPLDKYNTTESVTVQRCMDIQYILTASTMALVKDSALCKDMDDFAFDIVAGTPSPTNSPSIVPTPGPSSSPTGSPSIVPVSIPPSASCSVSLESECIAEDGSESCDTIKLNTECEDLPFIETFKYNGGSCAQSFNLQPPSVFNCTDFGTGPPSESGAQSFIVVSDAESGAVYFKELVTIGGDFSIEDAGNDLAPLLSVAVYRSADATDLLQTIIIQASCDRDFFLKDRFGSIQLISFVNQEQGEVSCFLSVLLSFDAENVGELNNATLQSLVSQGNIGSFDLTDTVNGVVLVPGASQTFTQRVQLDMTTRQAYTAINTLAAISSPQGFGCADMDNLMFEAGNALPPGVPTLTPSSSPSTTVAPTSPPENAECVLLPETTCLVTQGPNVACDSLKSPTSLICDGNVNPTELAFRYNGGSCPGDNNANGFRCDNRNGGPSGRQNVWMRVVSRGEVWFDEAVNQNDFIPVRANFADVTDITISSVDNNQAGTLLQNMRLRTTCDVTDDLTLLNSFGSLDLIGFSNRPTGTHWGSAMVTVRYHVGVQSATQAVIQRAESIGAFAGQRVLRATPSEAIGTRDMLDLGVESDTLDLTTGIETTYNFFLTVNGTAATNAANACGETGEFSFTVV